MPTAAITRTLLKNPPPLPAGADKLRVFDDRLKGFFVEFRRSCATFYFRYTDERGRKPEIKLGRHGDVTLDQARRKAEQLKAEVSLGGDPAGDRRRRRAVPLFADFVRERYLPHAAERLRSHANVEAYCRKRLVPALGRRALNEIGSADIAALRRRLVDEGLSNASVNRHLATLRSIFNLARKWQVYDGPNPAAAPGMLPEQHRDRYLSAEETQALVRALDAEVHRDAAAALAFLVFTGARKSEALTARWEHVDLDRRLLTVPRSKSGRPRHIPLSEPAIRVLRVQARRRKADNPHVFPGKTPGKPLEDLRGPWERTKRAAGLPSDLRIHDLRHSFASALANAGTPLNEIGVILGHLDLGMTERYAHHAPQRLVETATRAAQAWNLLPPSDSDGDGST